MINFETLNEVYRESQHGWVGRGPGILLAFAAANIGERFADIKAGRKPRVAVPDIDLLHADYDVECWSDYEHVWRETGIRYIWSGWVRPAEDEHPDAPGVTCDRCHRAAASRSNPSARHGAAC